MRSSAAVAGPDWFGAAGASGTVSGVTALLGKVMTTLRLPARRSAGVLGDRADVEPTLSAEAEAVWRGACAEALYQLARSLVRPGPACGAPQSLLLEAYTALGGHPGSQIREASHVRSELAEDGLLVDTRRWMYDSREDEYGPSRLALDWDPAAGREPGDPYGYSRWVLLACKRIKNALEDEHMSSFLAKEPRRSVVMERTYVAIALLICESLFGACPPAPELLAPVPATR